MAGDETDDELIKINGEVFRDCFSAALLQRISSDAKSRKGKKGKGNSKRKPRKSVGAKYRGDDQEVKEDQNLNGDDQVDANDASGTDGFGSGKAEELAELIEYLATELFSSLPEPLPTLSYALVQNSPSSFVPILEQTYTSPSSIESTLLPHLPPSIPETFQTYAILPLESLPNLLADTLSSYITSATAPPQNLDYVTSTSGGAGPIAVKECEICGRDWIPLTYHHLIPRSMHAKSLKRGWHEEWELQKVAWLCRACHSFVHRVVGNEELARSFYSVELLEEREDVQRWASWAGGVRWKSR